MASHPPIFAWRDEIDFTNSVTNAINDLFNNRNSFTVLAGGVFALQQDLKLALGVDLWNDTNLVRSLFDENGVSLPRPGPPHSAEQLSQVVKALDGIIRVNEDFCKEYRINHQHNIPSNLTPLRLEVEALSSGIRARAASAWLLTVMPPTSEGATMVRYAATNVWLKLCLVPMSELREWAEQLAGTHFNGARCEDFAIADWPHLIR
jgi:hypothetical protein